MASISIGLDRVSSNIAVIIWSRFGDVPYISAGAL